MPDLSELLERVKAATGPDRELDAAIWYALVEQPRPGNKIDRDMISRWPEYTSSLDAALALVLRASPLKGPVELTVAGSAQACLNSDDPCGLQVQAFGNTPPLALLAALLSALQKGEGQ